MNTQNNPSGNDKPVLIEESQGTFVASDDPKHQIDVNEYASRITGMISLVHKRIEEAKEKAKSVPDIKGGLFGWGKKDKQIDLLAKTDLATNEAVTELAKLQQETIHFITQSAYLARNMCNALSYIAVNGIRNADGRVERLSDETTKTINAIVGQAWDFVKQQESIKQAQLSQEETNRQLDAAMTEFDDELEKHKLESQKQQARLDKIAEQIEKNSTKEAKIRTALALHLKQDFGKNIDATNLKIMELQENTQTEIQRQKETNQKLVAALIEFDNKLEKIGKKLVIAYAIGAVGALSGIASLLLIFLA